MADSTIGNLTDGAPGALTDKIETETTAPASRRLALSDVKALVNPSYVLQVHPIVAGGIADAATIYFGGRSITPGTTGGNHRLYIPLAGTITAVYGSAVTLTTLATAETASLYLRLNNTTDTELTTTFTLDATVTTFSKTEMSVAVVAGDYVEIKFVGPNYATNPAGTTFSASILVKI